MVIWKIEQNLDAWQSLLYSLSPPSKYFLNTLCYCSLQCLTAPPSSKHSWTNHGKIIDPGHTNFYVLNSAVTELNFTKFLHKMIINWPSEIKIVIFQSLPECRCAQWMTIVKLWPSCNKNSTISLCKLRSYWTDVPKLPPLLMHAVTRRYCIVSES